jgi:copper chaperone CopZ
MPASILKGGDSMTEQTITLPVSGMTCANCALNIERGIKKLEGVQTTNVNFVAEQAVIGFDPKQLLAKDVVKNIQGSGYIVNKTRGTPSQPLLGVDSVYKTKVCSECN